MSSGSPRDEDGVLSGEEGALSVTVAWRCRRGIRELDVLLGRFVQQAWPHAPIAEKRCFERLLAYEDACLWQWFIGQDTCPDTQLANIVSRIRQLHP